MAEAEENQPIEPGRITIAPPNRHLLLDRKTVMLASGPKENWRARRSIRSFVPRRSITGLGRSASSSVASLMMGRPALWALKRRGGFAVVQTPGDAALPEMPNHALAAVDVDVVADAEEIGVSLAKWCRETSDCAVSSLADKAIEAENEFLARGGSKGSLDTLGVAAGVVCPDCGGQLWQMNEGATSVSMPRRSRLFLAHLARPAKVRGGRGGLDP